MPQEKQTTHVNGTEITFNQVESYREGYANSVQVRMSLWDFQLTFGTLRQEAPNAVTMDNFQAIYMSPQQAKSLAVMLQQNIAQYEQTFGKLSLEPQGTTPITPPIPFPQGGGPVN